MDHSMDRDQSPADRSSRDVTGYDHEAHVLLTW